MIKNTKIIVGVIILIAIVLIGAVLYFVVFQGQEDDEEQGQEDAGPFAGLEYVNTEEGFGFNPPHSEGWKEGPNHDYDQAIYVIYPETGEFAVLQIFFSIYSTDTPFEETIDDNLDYYSNSPLNNETLLSHGNITLNGMGAYYFLIFEENNGIKSKLIFVENNERVFTIEYWASPYAFDNYESEVNESLNTLVIGSESRE